MMILIEDVMTKNPQTLTQFNSLADAREVMKAMNFRHIPIVNEFDEVIGLVTQRLVYQNSVSAQTFLDEKELHEIEKGTLLADIMTKPVVTINPQTSIRKAAELIFHKKYGCLPVVDAKQKLVGIVTDHDFVGITIHLLEVIEDNEPLEFDDD